MTRALTLVSHALCPYVQRAAIALAEKGVAFARREVDLSAKPDWFLAVSPLGRTPVLIVDGQPVFESAVILEYLEDTCPPALHPTDPLVRARHRGWIEFGSAVLNGIAGLYSAPDHDRFAARLEALEQRFGQLEEVLGDGPWFAGPTFSLVDAAFAPVFRYFDVLDPYLPRNPMAALPKLRGWRVALAGRPSCRTAVGADYPARLAAFFRGRGSHLSALMESDADAGPVDAWFLSAAGIPA